MPRHREIKKQLVRKICNDLGIPALQQVELPWQRVDGDLVGSISESDETGDRRS